VAASPRSPLTRAGHSSARHASQKLSPGQTGWLGADLRKAEPHLARISPAGPGAVLVCSDGLWNYRTDAAGLASMAMPAALTDPRAAASALVTFAIEAGGADNVTVVIAPFPPPEPAAPTCATATEETRIDEPA